MKPRCIPEGIRRLRFAAAVFVFCATAPTVRSQTPLLVVEAEPFIAHVKFLASDELKGRGNGSPGLQRASEYIAGEFKKAGLQPGGDAGSYFQTFDITSRPEPNSGIKIAVGIQGRVRNVVGVIRGSDPLLADEAIVVGAHYDHLGLGPPPPAEGDSGFGAARPPAVAGRESRFGEIHNGADDNASGTAAVLEIARVAAAHRRLFKRSVVFATFAGEEIGLLGSKHYVTRAAAGAPRTKVMINLDMIGRARGRVMTGGTDRHRLLKHVLEEVRPLAMLRLDGFRDGYEDGASDNAPFLQDGVPALALFTGFHDDYHRPSDDWDRIDAEGAARIATVALAIVERLASRSELRTKN